MTCTFQNSNKTMIRLTNQSSKFGQNVLGQDFRGQQADGPLSVAQEVPRWMIHDKFDKIDNNLTKFATITAVVLSICEIKSNARSAGGTWWLWAESAALHLASPQRRRNSKSMSEAWCWIRMSELLNGVDSKHRVNTWRICSKVWMVWHLVGSMCRENGMFSTYGKPLQFYSMFWPGINLYFPVSFNNIWMA